MCPIRMFWQIKERESQLAFSMTLSSMMVGMVCTESDIFLCRGPFLVACWIESSDEGQLNLNNSFQTMKGKCRHLSLVDIGTVMRNQVFFEHDWIWMDNLMSANL